MLKTIKNFTLDTLFPIACLSCNAPDTWLCPTCLKKIEILPIQACPYCETSETPAGAICHNCRSRILAKQADIYLDNLIVATSYGRNNIARLVHTFKYSFVSDLDKPLASLITQAIFDNHLPLPDFIIPIPLHPRRQRWRGFNQAKLLSDQLATNISPGLPIPVLNDSIVRRRFTAPQMKIRTYQERKINIQNSFTLSEKISSGENYLKDKKILLLDDISTTDSTLLECAKILKVAGVKKVYGAVIARQEIK